MGRLLHSGGARERMALGDGRRFPFEVDKMNRQGPRLGSIGLAAITVVAFFCWARPAPAEDASSDTAPWLRHARIAGAELFAEMTHNEVAKNLSALADQNVSVIEADSDLSRLLTDKEFEAEIALMRRYCAMAHRLGMRVVWYTPALEVLSPNAAHGGRSMFRMHPTWVQQGLNGKPNVFFGSARGGKGRVHWVDADTESAWMSLHSPYSDMFVDRIKRIAATGVDGIWLDVPIYNDIGAEWADASPGAVAKFQADTGMQMSKRANWVDPAWRRWIAWRYQEISNFILRVRDAAKSVTGDIAIIVEIATLDHNAATMLGLDGSTMKAASGVIPVWEVDTVSDKTAMRDAGPDDWISLIGMSKFAKAASGKKPSWIFTYGKEPDDALLVMAEALAAGNNPYETKIPQMTTTVGPDYRKRMFSWIKQEEKRLFESTSGARIAVYFSPESRDYVDKAAGTGLFATTKSKDELWWSNEPEHSVYSLTYLAEYRGITKWLAHNHIPFDIIVRPGAAELLRYQTLIAPSLVAISDHDTKLLDQYVAKGGHLVVTGPNPAMLDEFGNQRRAPILKSLNRREGRQSASTSSSRRAGTMVHTMELVGKSYLISTSPAAGRAIRGLIGEHLYSSIETDADRDVHVELRMLENEMLLHLINPGRLWNSKPAKKDVSVRVEIPPGVTVADVHLTSPEPPEATGPNEKKSDVAAREDTTGRPARRPSNPTSVNTVGSRQIEPKDVGKDTGAGRTSPLAFTVKGNRVSFKVPLEAYEMVVVSVRPQ